MYLYTYEIVASFLIQSCMLTAVRGRSFIASNSNTSSAGTSFSMAVVVGLGSRLKASVLARVNAHLRILPNASTVGRSFPMLVSH